MPPSFQPFFVPVAIVNHSSATNPHKVLNFLGKQEKNMLMINTRFAKRCWGDAIFEARQCVTQNEWLKAFYFHGKATELAEVLLVSDFERKRAEIRYARTAAELAYTLRKLGRMGDLKALKKRVSEQYDQLELRRDKSDLMKPLNDVFYASEERLYLSSMKNFTYKMEKKSVCLQ